VFAITDALGKGVFDTGDTGHATLKLGFRDEDAMSDDNGLTQGMFLYDPRQPTLSPADHVSQQRYDVSLTHGQRFDEHLKLTTLAYAYRTQDYDRNTAGAALLTLSQYDYWVSAPGDTSLTGGALYFRNTDTILDRHYDVAGVEPRFEWRTNTACPTTATGSPTCQPRRSSPSPTDPKSGLGGEVAWTGAPASCRPTRRSTWQPGTSFGAGLTFKLSVTDATNQMFAFARRPDGIQVAGFRQIIAGVRWDWDAAPAPAAAQ
jgi:hypothetical protein